MIFSYNWIKQYIKARMPGPEELAELLMFHSFEIEGLDPIRKPSASNGAGKKGDDWVIDIDVLPNRAHDCLCHIGVARDLAAVAGLEMKLPKALFQENKSLKAADFLEVEVRNSDDCPRYTAKVITGVKAGVSPKWMQEKLEVCGLQAINSIVDITNYVMLETGQPLHAFDADKIAPAGCHPEERSDEGSQNVLKGNKTLRFAQGDTKVKIIVRRAKAGEKLAALDDKTYTLDENILVIADEKRPVAIAGIKGGEETGIDNRTKTIIIEAANFNPVLTRKASQKLKLRTDASWRFENSPDPNLIDFAQERVCSLIQEIAGGEVVEGMIDVYPKKVKPKKIKLDSRYLNRLLGVDISKAKIQQILKSLGFRFHVSPKESHSDPTGQAGFMFYVEAPTRRVDVSSAEDLIEEIGRVYGYENIPSVFPAGMLKPPKRNDELFWENNIRDILKDSGFCEAYGYSFVGDTDKDAFNYSRDELVELANPVSSLNRYLRPSLIPNLIKITKENLKYFDLVKMFEIGHIFKKKNSVLEKTMLTCILTGKSVKDDGFYELKGVVDSLLNKLGISDVWYDSVGSTPEDSRISIWHPGKSAEIKVVDNEIGFLGQLHPAITCGFNVKEKIFLLDLDFSKLLKEVSEEHEYRPISPYPAVLRDIALLVPFGTKTVDILNAINQEGGTLVRDVDLFDIYSGKEVPDGKENFAFHIIYQSEKKTLSSQEVDKVHQKIVKALESNADWEVRR